MARLSLAVELLCTIIKVATGKTIRQLLMERVLRPGGLLETDWESTASDNLATMWWLLMHRLSSVLGHGTGATGIYMSADGTLLSGDRSTYS